MRLAVSNQKLAGAPKKQSGKDGRLPGVRTPENYPSTARPANIFRKASCACGGGCPTCQSKSNNLKVSQPNDAAEIEADQVAENMMQVSTASGLEASLNHQADQDPNEESRAHQVVSRFASSHRAVRSLAAQWGDRRPASGNVGRDVIETIQSFTGPLPSNLTLRTGSDIDTVLTIRGARGLASGQEIWVGGPHLAPNPGGFASVFVHEAAHVASGASASKTAPHFGLDDPLAGSWYEAELERQAALEAAETGAGRQQTLDRLAAMPHAEVRREAPGIAFRAQDRGDIPLAIAAADRLLATWLESTEVPYTFISGFGPPDAVDALLDRSDSALRSGHVELGGKYLSIAMVQLVRAARQAVLRRYIPGDDLPENSIREIFLPLQRGNENEIQQRVLRARELLESQGQAVLARGNQDEIAQFEGMAESVRATERRAGAPIPEDLGTGGVFDAPEPAPARSHRGGGTGRGPAGAPAAAEAAETPPARPEPTPETPVSRAAEQIVDSAHPDLEGALVFFSTSPPTTYSNIRSPRYGVAGTLSGAHRLANEMFGRRSSVIVEDIHARDPHTSARQVRYLILALTVHINPPNPTLGAGGQVIAYEGIQMLMRPASRQYFFLAVTSGDWQLFAPTLLGYINGVRSSEENVEAVTLSPETRRETVFGPIDELIANGETQEAANQLTYVGARGFALVDTAAKTRYITTLLQAFTFQANEDTVVEVFRALSGASELREVLSGLNRAGVLRQLHTDLESAFPSLLITVGQVVGSQSLSASQARRLMSELRLFTPFPGLEVRGDGSFALNTDLAGEFVAAVEGLVATITSAVTGIVDIILDPETFFKGLAKIFYFVFMANLASHGHEGAMRYVDDVVAGVARQIGAATRGLAALQENMPAGVEFVRDLQRSIEWRIIWEVVGLFVGVGEAVAIFRAIRGGSAATAISELSSASRAARLAGATEEAVDAARLTGATDELADAARVSERGAEAVTGGADEAAGGVGRTGRAAEEAVASREISHGARLRRRADGRRTICINPCAELDHLSLSDDVIDAAVRNLPEGQTQGLVETLAAFKGADDIPTVEALVTSLSRGGDEAASAANLLERISEIRRIEGLEFRISDLAAAHRRGDAILAHGPLQTGEFLEDMVWGGSPIGPWEIHDGRLVFPNRASLTEHRLPERLQHLDFVIIAEESGRTRLVLGRQHSGLSGGRPWVFGAGEFVLDREGRIISINRMSGHYQPAPGNPARVRDFLRERGILGRGAVDAIDDITP